jgi:serine/threonine protein kinase
VIPGHSRHDEPPFSIARYRITAKLGEGGMGAVYRATDTKLNREVAIKVLPDSFAADSDRLPIHRVEDRAIIMELVEGQSPAGPFTAAQALPLIQQSIDALEYAHDKGAVHRDLKPANIATRAGRAVMYNQRNGNEHAYK